MSGSESLASLVSYLYYPSLKSTRDEEKWFTELAPLGHDLGLML